MRPMWAALAFVFVTGVLARVLQAGVTWGGSATDWFQALGSVAAIFAAIGVAWHEGSRETRRAKEALRQYRLTVAVLACRMADLIDALAANLKADPEYYFREGKARRPSISWTRCWRSSTLLGSNPPRARSACTTFAVLEPQPRATMNSVAGDFESDSAISPDLFEGLTTWPRRARQAADVLARLAGDPGQVRAMAAAWSK